MKKFLLSFLPLLLALVCGFKASAQDIAVTVTWETPGTVSVYKAATYNPGTAAIDLPAEATSYTITDKAEYVFYPAEGYCMTSALIEGTTTSALAANSYSDFTQVCKISTKYPVGINKFNNKTVAIKLEKLVYNTSFDLEIHNGAEKVSAKLFNGTTQTRTLEVSDGKQNIKLSQFENKLELQSTAFPRSAFHTVTLDGNPVEYKMTKYSMDIADGSKVYVAVGDPATTAPAAKCKVTFEFVNDNPACIATIRDWTANKFLDLEQIAEGYELSSGTQIQLNIKDDYTVNSITANDAAYTPGTRYTVEGNTKFVVDIKGTTYTPLSAKIYTNMIEALSFSNSTQHAEAGEITVTAGDEKPAGSVTFNKTNYTIGIPTTEYALGNISGKTKNVFFNLKPGYYIKSAVLGNPSDPQNTSLAGMMAFRQAEAPVFFDIAKIDFNTPASVYYEGPEGVARLRAKYAAKDGSLETVTYEGAKPGEVVANGLTDIKFDPDYDSYFEVSIYADAAHQNFNKYVYLDGVAQIPNGDDSEAPGVFSNIKLKKDSKLVIIFSEAVTEPESRTISFLTAGDVDASLSYDGITVTDFSKDITAYFDGQYTITPEAGTTVKVNGEAVTLSDGKYIFSPEAGSETLIQLVKDGFGVLDCDTDPATGSTVKSLSSVEVLLAMDESFATGESTPNIVESPARWISVSNGAKVASFEVGDPSETAIPFTLTLDKPITAAGTYTISIPAGIIYQAFPNADFSDYNRTAASKVNPQIDLQLTVDPDMTYKWSFDPAAGSENDLPGSDGDNVIVTLSLPDAKSLSEEAMTAGTGPWFSYNGAPVAKVDDPSSEEGWAFIQTMATYGKPALAVEISKSVFNKVGQLSITADEGAFTVNGVEPSPAIEYTAQFGKKVEYSYEFTPAVNTEISDWSEFTLTFPTAGSITIDEDNAYVMLAQGMSWGTMNVEMTVNGNSVTFKPQSDGEPSTGTLTLTIGEGTFILDGVNASPEIAGSWSYTRAAAVNFDWTPSPKGKILNEGWGVYAAIVYDEVEKVQIADASAIVVKFDDQVLPELNWDDASVMGVQVVSEGANTLMINAANGLLSDASTTGTLSVSIPAGALLISGKPNPEAIEYSWDVVAAKEYEVTVTPASGKSIHELSKITVKFGGAESVELNESFINSWISVKKGYSVIASATGVTVGDDGVATITFDPISAAGDYTVSIQYGTFFLDGVQDSESMILKYTVDPTMTGIDEIEADGGLYTVFNMQGILLLRDASADQLRKLPAGIYIINGRKIAL